MAEVELHPPATKHRRCRSGAVGRSAAQSEGLSPRRTAPTGVRRDARCARISPNHIYLKHSVYLSQGVVIYRTERLNSLSPSIINFHQIRSNKNDYCNIWNGWTRLSLATYTFLVWVFLIYDENHHLYLLAFMAVATLPLSSVDWFFLRRTAAALRVLSLLGGFIGAAIVVSICDAT